MCSTAARTSIECKKKIKFVTGFCKLKKKSHDGFWANGESMHWDFFQCCQLSYMSSTNELLPF